MSILDTDIASLFREGHPKVTAKVLAHPIAELAITIITVEEMLGGWYQKLRQNNSPEQLESIYTQMTRTLTYVSHFNVLTYTVASHLRFRELQAMRLNVGAYDLRIAAIALETNGILVTRNTRDFERVPGLMIADWTM